MVPVTAVAVLSLDPLEIEIEPTSAAPIPDDAGLGVYLHLLGSTFAGERIGPRALRVVPPRPGTPVDTRWQDWIGLADPAGALVGSPVLLFPPHQLDARVAIPLGFDGGTLSLHVTAADGASYVASPVLPVADPALANAHGNESPHATITVALRSLAPPPEANVAAFDPAQRLWARSAANYAEEAAWRVEWAPVVSAARYEVWRVLDNAVPGANRETSDLELRQLAASAGKFAVRSNRVFGTSFVDGIPGRAPVRALYRVRAISPAGIPGSFSDVIGPIYVPDVRPPRPPNILRVAAVPPEEAERSILVEWAAESEPDVRFEIWSSDAEGSNPPLQLAGSIAAGSSPDSDGRYRFVHGDRRPGRVTAYEVRAVREVLDPIDPGAEVRRDIASLPSKRLAAAALRSGPLVAPLLTGAEAGAAGVRLSWTVRDFYDSIEIRRRAPDRFGYETVGTVSGGATTFLDTPPTSGLFAYRLRAIGASRTAEADELSVEVA
jgi:hypothetical protein